MSKIFTPTLYADAGILLGSRFFPKIKLYANGYKGLKNDFEARAGVSFDRLQNDQNYFTIKLGAAKTWEDIWVNAQLSLMNTTVEFIDKANLNNIITTKNNFYYTNLMVQARINVNARKDYFSLIVSGGSAPFDQQLQYQENTFLNFSNVMVGAGYKYNMSAKTAILVDGTWINFQNNQSIIQTVIQEIYFTNQYNLAFTFITHF